MGQKLTFNVWCTKGRLHAKFPLIPLIQFLIDFLKHRFNYVLITKYKITSKSRMPPTQKILQLYGEQKC